MKKNVKNHQTGFTLIEFIVSLVLVAILGSMIYTYFGNVLTQSSVPIARLQQASNLQKVMENIVADYNRLNRINLRYNWQPSTYYGINAVITPKTIPASINGGHYYVSTQAGTSTATEPNPWPLAGGTITDGGVIWKESGNIVWQKSHPYSSGNIVVPIKSTGHYYRCTTGGTSGATAPAATAWLPTTVPSTPWTITGDGTVTWTETGTILDSSDSSLQDNIKYILTNNPGKYGTGYSVVASETKFIQFDSNNIMRDYGTSGTSNEKNILKVTIKNNDSAETLTHYFTIR